MNIVRIIRKSACAAAIMAVSLFSVSCDKDEDFGISGSDEGISYNYPGKRTAHVESRRVLLFYECGHNELYSYLKEDMESEKLGLPNGYLPGNGRNEDVVLIFSKLAKNLSFRDVPSYLRRIYRDIEGNMVSDTLKIYPESTVASSSATMKEVLDYVRALFPAKGYGMVFASHGSGWLPTGYYNDPTWFERNHRYSNDAKYSRMFSYPGIPKGNMATDDPFAGLVRSIGQDKMSYGDQEMSVKEFAEGIPFHLDYLFFDICFGGGVEIAYALKDKADYLGISPAEVLADGMFDYTKLVSFLLEGSSPDFLGLFTDSFERYNKRSGDARSATVTLLRTNGLENLASVCKQLVSKYSSAIANAPVSKIQGFFRYDRHYFYDLEDTFVQCGVSSEDLNTLRRALDACIVYKNATPSFLGEFDIRTYSGLSMYLPCNGSSLLNSYFRNEEWNKAVGLVN